MNLANAGMRVCAVLELLHGEDWPEKTPAEWQAASSRIYRWCHCARAHDCVKNHPDWWTDFEALEAVLIAERRIPDLRQEGVE